MRRRTFITLLGGATAWPLAAGAQQPVMPVVGVLLANEDARFIAGFRQGIREAGFIEGRNVAIEYRSVEDHYDRFPAVAADLLRRQVSVIVTPANATAVLAAKQATTTIPIVFVIGANPVEFGFVRSLNRPAGNITGISLLNAELDPKRLGLIAELTPDATIVAFLVNPDSPTTPEKIERVQTAARTLQRKLEVLNARTVNDLDDAFAIVAQRRIRALLIAGDGFLNLQSQKIAALASRYAVPVISANREAPASGALMSYGPSLSDAYRQAGIYTGRILKGEKPADMPVMQPTKFEFVINLKTAKALGLTFPPGLLAIVDEAIE